MAPRSTFPYTGLTSLFATSLLLVACRSDATTEVAATASSTAGSSQTDAAGSGTYATSVGGHTDSARESSSATDTVTNTSAATTGEDTGTAPPPTSCVAQACAFPGAQGFGTSTPGGRGGRVIAVTTLAADGPGSFAEAMLTPGPRIIVFRVSGVIDLQGAYIELLEEHSYVTVAGQSSPGGITVLNGTISNYHTNFHDAIFRFLRIRGSSSYDNVSLSEAHDFVFDHCDFSGATDETFDVTSSHDFTVQWSTVTNSLIGGDAQNYGMLLAYKPTSNISLHHNLSAHHGGRCGAQFHWSGDLADPVGGAAIDIRNNVYYNCGFQQIYRADDVPATGSFYDLVGNFAISGPNTPAESMFFGLSGSVFMSDNLYEGQTTILTPYFEGELRDQSYEFPEIDTTDAAQAYDDVLAWAGVWPRDEMMVRTVDEVRSRDGSLGKHDDPLREVEIAAPPDGDSDGIPDAWESAHGLDPADPADGSMRNDSGYTNVERYLNELADALIGTN